MITRVLSVTFLAAMLVFANLALSSKASGAPPFGTQEDLKYAERLWTAMRDARLVGNQAISAMPYEGSTHKDILNHPR